MVLTVPGCPLANLLALTVREKVEAMAEGKKVAVELLNEPWMPPWSDGMRWVDME
jgi:metal-sulfur cluster biosynthetic enzyme